MYIFHRRNGRLKKPHHAVCSEVLNLPSQVGCLLQSSALAEAYRVTIGRLGPILRVLAQNRSAASRAQQGNCVIPQKNFTV
jgi:hypothetical protein